VVFTVIEHFDCHIPGCAIANMQEQSVVSIFELEGYTV
jgi:hypothetical protein